jgi:hypothetical protein
MKKPLVIFELANNHMGDLGHAVNIIKRFYNLSKSYSDKIDFALKFQFRDLKTYIHPNYLKKDYKQHKQVNRFLDTKFTDKEWKKIIAVARKKFKIICTPFDEISVDKIIDYNFDFLKIASCSMDEWPLLEYIAKTAKKKNIIASLGGGNEDSIRNVISFFESKKIKVQYLYCVAKYPTTPDKLNLSYFKYLKDLYGDKISGISTHEAPNEAISGALAFSMGARIFEKHIGLQSGTYLLNEYSVDLDNAKVWLSNLKDAIIRVGSIDARNQFLKYEKENLSLFKRGAFLKKNVNKKKDDQLTIKDVNFFYPAQNGQLLSNDFSKFNNFKLIKKVKENRPLFLKDLKILNTRNAIQVIRNKIANLIYRSKVIIKKKNIKIEISHHYGLQNYYSFGMSMITIFNEKYCKKLLFLLYKQKHPDQYHKKKQETFFVLFGKIKLNLKVKKKNFSYHLKPGEIFTIKAGVIHNFESISKEGSVIEELSTHSNSNDSYYLDKKISKNSERKSFISLY